MRASADPEAGAPGEDASGATSTSFQPAAAATTAAAAAAATAPAPDAAATARRRRAARDVWRRRQAAALSLLPGRPLASALALGLAVGALAGGAWHSGRQQALLLASQLATSSNGQQQQQPLAITTADAAAAAAPGAPTATTATATTTTPAAPVRPPHPPGEKGDAVHVIFTSNGSPYGNFQGRLHYASFLRAQRTGSGNGGGGGGESGGGAPKLAAFTRILHRTQDDFLVREIPTFRADPLEPACDDWCLFPVKDRADAIDQWLRAADRAAAARAAADRAAAAERAALGQKSDAPPLLPEPLLRAPWILMLETDYVWRYPIAAPGDAADPSVLSKAFIFDYMAPQDPAVAPFVREMCDGRCEPAGVLASGPAPVLLRASELRAAVGDWVRLSAWIEGREDAREALGWVREMYAWCVAAARAGIRFDAAAPPRSPLALQPPHDTLPPPPFPAEAGAAAAAGASAGDGETTTTATTKNGAAVSSASSPPVQPAVFHYTWGAIFHEGTKEGPEVWRFDKRDFTSPGDALRPPALPAPPPWREGLVLQDGVAVTRALRDTLAEMVGLMNAAGAELRARAGVV